MKKSLLGNWGYLMPQSKTCRKGRELTASLPFRHWHSCNWIVLGCYKNLCGKDDGKRPKAGGESLEGSEWIYICVFKSSAYFFMNFRIWLFGLRHFRNWGSRMGRKRDVWTNFGRTVSSHHNKYLYKTTQISWYISLNIMWVRILVVFMFLANVLAQVIYVYDTSKQM